jgi:hypothetical protein
MVKCNTTVAHNVRKANILKCYQTLRGMDRAPLTGLAVLRKPMAISTTQCIPLLMPPCHESSFVQVTNIRVCLPNRLLSA